MATGNGSHTSCGRRTYMGCCQPRMALQERCWRDIYGFQVQSLAHKRQQSGERLRKLWDDAAKQKQERTLKVLVGICDGSAVYQYEASYACECQRSYCSNYTTSVNFSLCLQVLSDRPPGKGKGHQDYNHSRGGRHAPLPTVQSRLAKKLGVVLPRDFAAKQVSNSKSVAPRRLQQAKVSLIGWHLLLISNKLACQAVLLYCWLYLVQPWR